MALSFLVGTVVGAAVASKLKVVRNLGIYIAKRKLEELFFVFKSLSFLGSTFPNLRPIPQYDG